MLLLFANKANKESKTNLEFIYFVSILLYLSMNCVLLILYSQCKINKYAFNNLIKENNRY